MGPSRPGRFERWFGSGPRDNEGPPRWLSPTGAFLWLALATTLVAVVVLATSC